jgi:glycosyltransferase involved in cell wall biosynthesis
MITVNGRFQSHRVTGVERYATEICKRLESAHQIVHPKHPLKGVRGHLWEQTVLPNLFKSGLLWSPCNTGPLIVRRQVITIHDLATLDHPEWFSARFSSLYKLIMPALIRRAVHVLTVSDYTKRRIVRTFATDERKITVIPNGIEERFKPQPVGDINRVTRSLGIPEGPYLLSVCSLEPRKNLARLLAAWSILNAKGVQATLVLAGAQGSSSVFKAVCLGSIPDRVMFTGYVADEDLPALYSGARAFVYPSLYEGFGLPILEALASGTKVIAGNTTSIPEVAGPSAMLINPMSIHEIAGAMERALTQSLDLIALSSGIEHARRYTWDTSASETERLLLSYS